VAGRGHDLHAQPVDVQHYRPVCLDREVHAVTLMGAQDPWLFRGIVDP
jgi:hypothetical protein